MPKNKTKRQKKSQIYDDIYIVEKILDKRVENGKTSYYIKWLNYSHAHNSWEPRENIFSDSLIERFESERAKQQSEHPKKFCHKTIEKREDQLIKTEGVDIFKSEPKDVKPNSNGGSNAIIIQSEKSFSVPMKTETKDIFDSGLIDVNQNCYLGSNATTLPTEHCSSSVAIKTEKNDVFNNDPVLDKQNLNIKSEATTLPSEKNSTLASQDVVQVMGLTEKKSSQYPEGQLMFVFKLDDGTIQYYHRDEAKIMYPQLVIDYYERHMTWENE